MPGPGTGLDKPSLKAAIVQYLTDLSNNEDEDMTPAQAIDQFATHLSDAIDTFVRSGLVTTTGTSTNQTGLVT